MTLFTRFLMALPLMLILVAILTLRAQAAERELEVERTPAQKSRYTCVIRTGYGTAYGYGESPLKAKENARLICGDKIIDGYLAQRGNIPEDAVGPLSTACVNYECE
ncbi:MAG: hypothetical protein AB7G93_15580 [Bdellovibrionales bacterium]